MLQSMGSHSVGHDLATEQHLALGIEIMGGLLGGIVHYMQY